MTSAKHVVIDNRMRLQCLHCKATYRPESPIPAWVWSAIIAAFIERHRDCVARAER